jgi:predicted CXXCH cytochrome family protein
MKILLLGVLALTLLSSRFGDSEGRILRPQDGSVYSSFEVDIVATAPDGRLEFDGQKIPAEKPFPDVLHARVKTSPGEHSLALIWSGERKEIRFFVGDGPPMGFLTFRQHPPVPTKCTQCHGLSRRGRFRFKGGCFDCHDQEAFVGSHEHPPHILEDCGQCHNAHGSTSKAHLLLPREQACRLCHN